MDAEVGRRKKNSKVQRKQKKKKVINDKKLCLSMENITDTGH